MAALASAATGNLTAAATWALINSTSFLNSQSANTALTTSYVTSSTFTPGAITIDGIAVKIASRAGSPTGTITVALDLATATVTGTEIAINVSDLPTAAATDPEGGWILFKFAAPVLLVAATAYGVKAKTSSSSQVNLFSSATTNWSRFLRTTTTQAPVAGDDMYVLGEHTGAGTGNSFVVTMNSTAATDYGASTTSLVTPAISVCKRGTLDYGSVAATNYILRTSGHLIVYNQGTFNIGTVATPIPRGGSAVLEFDVVADGDRGLVIRNGGTFVAQGLSRTSGKNVVKCKLNTNETVAQTVLGVDTDTGWLSGDDIAIAPTTRTATEGEKRTLSVNASATTVTVSSGLTNAHSGTSPTQAEVILLTRNVNIRSVTSTLMSYVSIKETATVDIDWVRFRYLGESATDKRGINIQTTTGSCNIQFCSLEDFEDEGIYITGAAANNVTIANNVAYLLGTTGVVPITVATATSGTLITLDNNILIRCRFGFSLSDIGITCTNNTVAGVTSTGVGAFSLAELGGTIGTFSGNVAHSCIDEGFVFKGNSSGGFVKMFGTITDCVAWRNSSYGFYFTHDRQSTGVGQAWTITLENCDAFGNTTANLLVDFRSVGGAHTVPTEIFLTLNNCDFSGDSTFATTNGIRFMENTGGTNATPLFLIEMILNSCTFGVVSGIKTAHTNDINFSDSNIQIGICRITMNNCSLASATEINTPANAFNSAFLHSKSNFIKSTKHDQTAGNHKSWFIYGIITSDSTIFRTASPAERLTPNNASQKLESGSKKVAVNSGATVTPSVYVRESVAGDGTDYNGARIRLIVKRNDALGITADTVLDTATVSSEGAFEQLTGTTVAVSADGVLEFIIDCDGTTGWANDDDWSFT